MGLYINPGNEAFKISIQDDIYIDQSGILIRTTGSESVKDISASAVPAVLASL